MYVTDYAGPRYRVKLDDSVGTRMNWTRSFGQGSHSLIIFDNLISVEDP
jgi:hypothetical protein